MLAVVLRGRAAFGVRAIYRRFLAEIARQRSNQARPLGSINRAKASNSDFEILGGWTVRSSTFQCRGAGFGSAMDDRLDIGMSYVFSGVRPSSGAATLQRDMAFEYFNTLKNVGLAAPEDGRTPLTRYGMSGYIKSGQSVPD